MDEEALKMMVSNDNDYRLACDNSGMIIRGIDGTAPWCCGTVTVGTTTACTMPIGFKDEDEVEPPEFVDCNVFGDSKGLYFNLNFDDESVVKMKMMSNIVNVEQPNDKTVFVQFADGTKEVAVCSADDVFSFETGVLICLFKKILGEPLEDFGMSGSSAYNKLIKYALGKKNAKKKELEAERQMIKANKAKLNECRQRAKRYDEETRNNRISEMKQAFSEALAEWKQENN